MQVEKNLIFTFRNSDLSPGSQIYLSINRRSKRKKQKEMEKENVYFKKPN